MTPRKKLACAMLALSLGACQGTGLGNMSTGETIGTVGGAAGGALLGSQFGSGTGQIAATAIGTLVGAFAGREVGRRLGDTDQRQATIAERQSIERNSPITWNNPQSGNRGTIRPTNTYRNGQGQLCREYTHTINVEGRAETARGNACQQADGTWQLVS